MKHILFVLTLLFISLPSFSYTHAENVELWGTSVSPYVRKVMNVPEYKKIDYKHKEIWPTVVPSLPGKIATRFSISC